MEPADLAFAGLARQAELIRAGEVSPREAVEVSLARIDRIDRRLRSFRVVLGERALAEADQAAARREAGDERPLLGVPVAIKDDVDVAGEVTAYGSAGHDPSPRREDAEVVRRLRAAGAIVIGKTNVPELTIFPFTESAAFGVTRNPWDEQRSPGGSSGGSGAAVAAGLVAAALGSDGAGSVRIPAACCGLFGLKPQRDRIPLAPKKEGWHGLNHLGPLTRSVADAALFLDVTADVSGGARYADAARTVPGRLRIAASRNLPVPGTPVAAEPTRAWEEAIEVLRGLGHEVVERDIDWGPTFFHVVARYLRGIHDDAAAIADRRRLERRTRGMARLGALVPPARLEKLRAGEEALARRLGEAWDDCDVLLQPALAQLPLEIEQFEGRGALWTVNGAARLTPWTGPWNVTGQPAAAVPMGVAPGGLPLAVQLVAKRDGEVGLLSLAAQIEAERPWAERRPPIAA